MHFFPSSRLIRIILLLLLLGSLVGILAAKSVAQERRTLELRLGGSDIINPTHPVTRVTIAGPKIADVVVLSPREIYVYGLETGYTSMILWQDGEGKTLLDVVVSLDLTGLKERLHQLYPNERIEVHSTETGIVLSGTVSGPEVVEQALRLAQSYFPKEAEGEKGKEGTGRSSSGITNLLKVGGNQQIMLEVKFAEVSRRSTREWQAGFGLEGTGDVTGAFGTSGVFRSVTSPGTVNPPLAPPVSGTLVGTMDGMIQNPSSVLVNFAGLSPNLFLNIKDFTAGLRFLESEGLARILAEPRLVTQSGQEASFLAGGEFPIPVPQQDRSITIEFKEFGVGLRFTPVLLGDGKISLRVAPSVSEISSTSVIPAGIQGANFVVPNLATRRLETNVQLHDGQTLALAGLLQNNLRETVSKIPGLGDLPVLGSLFRSKSYQQDKTDLLIAVTPRIVKPLPEGAIEFPGEFMKSPNRLEFYLEGRLEGRRDGTSAMGRGLLPPQASRSADLGGGLEGEFGHQTLRAEIME
jgi:pilus assembly protein CpaC